MSYKNGEKQFEINKQFLINNYKYKQDQTHHPNRKFRNSGTVALIFVIAATKRFIQLQVSLSFDLQAIVFDQVAGQA